MKTLKDAEFQGKVVLIRVDYNVPLDEDKNVTDNLRIVSTIPTIDYILENVCKLDVNGRIAILVKEKIEMLKKEGYINE